jgi:hypothetical protein
VGKIVWSGSNSNLMTEGRNGRSALSDVRTRAIEGKGMRVNDMSDVKALKIAGRSKKKCG